MTKVACKVHRRPCLLKLTKVVCTSGGGRVYTTVTEVRCNYKPSDSVLVEKSCAEFTTLVWNK